MNPEGKFQSIFPQTTNLTISKSVWMVESLPSLYYCVVPLFRKEIKPGEIITCWLTTEWM